MTSHYTSGTVTTVHDVGGVFGTVVGHFLLGSHTFMVTALGSCVNWPLIIVNSINYLQLNNLDYLDLSTKIDFISVLSFMFEPHNK